ncbi:MAG: type IV conjugative transfer system protein TraE [Desulfobulbus sp.]|nr:type IV conjugative transfer system protein TraE [Desulfobulbus sp.]
MKHTTFLQQSSNLFAQNRLLRFVVVVLSACLVFTSIMTYRAVRYQKVILIPPQMTGTVEFVQGKPTEAYIQDISRRIVSLATTYSPGTARKQFNELLVYYAPESYPEASILWYSLAGRIEESQVNSVFYPQTLTMKDNRIEVFGDLKQYTGNTRLENTTRTYFLDYQVRDGRFSLLAFREKEKLGSERSEQ